MRKRGIPKGQTKLPKDVRSWQLGLSGEFLDEGIDELARRFNRAIRKGYDIINPDVFNYRQQTLTSYTLDFGMAESTGIVRIVKQLMDVINGTILMGFESNGRLKNVDYKKRWMKAPKGKSKANFKRYKKSIKFAQRPLSNYADDIYSEDNENFLGDEEWKILKTHWFQDVANIDEEIEKLIRRRL